VILSIFSVAHHASRFTFHIARFALAILLLAACTGQAARVTQKQTVDGVTIAFDQPQQVSVLQEYEFVLTLTDAAGQPIEGATVFLDQDMPSMPMGTNQPVAESIGGGRYRIRGVFTMDGEWHVTVHAIVAGNDHRATFAQQVAPAS